MTDCALRFTHAAPHVQGRQHRRPAAHCGDAEHLRADLVIARVAGLASQL